MHIVDLSSLLLSFVSLFLSVVLGLYTWTRRQHKGAIPIAIILFSEAFWILGFILEMLAGSLEARVFWDLFQWIFGPFLAIGLFELSWSLSDPSPNQKRFRRLLFAFPFVTALLVATNPIHNLVISNPRLVESPFGSALIYEYTSVDYVIMILAYGLVLISFIRLVSSPVWDQKIYQLQIISILTGFGIIIIGSFLPLLDISVYWGQRDISPITFGLSNLVLAGGLFYFYLFDIGTLARNLVVDAIDDPMIVVDTCGQIVDINNAARKYFGFSISNLELTVKKDLPEKWGQLFDRFEETQSFRGEVTIQLGDCQRVMNLTISAIVDERNLLQGRLFFIRDITEQKQAEEVVRATEESYTRLFNTVKEAIYILAPDGVFLDVNDGAAKMYGYSREELIGKTPAFVSAVGKNDLQEISKMINRVLESGISEEFQFLGKRENGEEFPKECIANRGKYFGRDVVITTARDVTERKRAENALRESENKFRCVIKHASDGIALTDQNGIVIEWNPAMEEITGLQRQSAIDRPVWDVVFQMLPREKRTKKFQDVNERQWRDQIHGKYTNKAYMVEYPIEDLQQNRKIIQSNGFGVETMQGILGGVIMRDVTARKKAEVALQESEKRFHLLFDTAIDGIVLTKPNGTIHSANPAALKLLGYDTEAEIRGQDRSVIVDTSDPDVKRAIAERDHVGFAKSELMITRKDGSTFPAEMKSVLFYQEDVLASNFFLDISEQKAAEKERNRLIAELQNKNQELEKFSYTVSHDLKAPLFTIQGFMGYLERDIISNRTERIHDDIDRINGAIEKMQRLLNELLELSRIGRLMNAPEEIPFDVIVSDAANRVAGRIATKDVVLEIEPNLPSVYCDRTRMVQVLQNLLDNAVKFMGEQPEPHIRIGHLSENNNSIFFVQDNGLGIPSDYQESIFGLFDKLDAKAEGTGVGLALVRRIIEIHGGRIWVESEGLGKGSTFYFTIPDHGKNVA
jgi:PAS domain S-box-containing protein